MSELSKEYESSLKSIETENFVDRIFYRPIGFRIAKTLTNTFVTPNAVTIVSIFVGAAVGYFFYVDDIIYNICGILLLVLANILDCVDGQLARMTGIKSEIGRILDGVAGDIWFASIYCGFAMRTYNIYGDSWIFLLMVLSGISHLVQANITDYYKTLHLFFISKEKGAEFQTLEQIKRRYDEMKPGVNKTFYWLYTGYSLLQIKATPKLQKMLSFLSSEYNGDIPDNIRLDFRKKSKAIMPYVDLLTFNGRTIVMFAIVLSGYVWVYFVFEIIILNIILLAVMRKHENMCMSFSHK